VLLAHGGQGLHSMSLVAVHAPMTDQPSGHRLVHGTHAPRLAPGVHGVL
jgi:hypothetical protein